MRVSDATKQDSLTQHHVIEEYAQASGLTVQEWREFNLSGSKTNKTARGINQLIEDLNQGDLVLVSDVARLGRDDIHSVLNTITGVTGKGAELHFCYSKTAIKPEDNNDISKIFIAIGEAYAAVKFAQERSLKAKAACERRTKNGLANGRPVGTKVKSKLDDHAVLIIGELKKGTKKTRIVEILKNKGLSLTRSGLYHWINQKTEGMGINKTSRTED